MRVDRWTANLVAAACVLLSAAPAAAYCRTTAEPEPTFVEGCSSQGPPLYWPSQCVGYRLQQEAAQLPQVASLVTRAFARWTNPGEPCLPSLAVVALMPTSGRDVGYDADGPNSNLIVFRTESWSWDPAELEHTTVTYVLHTGEILDADMEINAVYPEYDVGADPGSYDLETVLTHGAGHFLGFAHAEAPSVMDGTLPPGESRALSADDAQGMCDVYPEGGERLVGDSEGNEVRIPARTCSFAETTAETSAECGPLDVAHGCAVARAPVPGEGWTLAAWAALASASVRRRRRRAGLAQNTTRGGAEVLVR